MIRNSQTGIAHRPDIDGLRAFAVTPVVLYHAGAPGLSGGFTGVDIFFVISGFLITGLLYRELSDKGTLNIRGFYSRRVARIFPSMILVVLVTVVASVFLLSSTLFEVQSLTKSAVASLAFVANFYFLNVTTSYFAAASGDLPLLHMWSLAVEEQYYLAWPLLMLSATKFRIRQSSLRACCIGIVIVVSVSSVLYAAYLTNNFPAVAFYSPLSRAWELGCGSALALMPALTPRRYVATLAAVLGAILVLTGFVVVRERVGFPFPYVLLPVLGTVLLLWSGSAAPAGIVARMLALPPLISIGRVSYAWYLWHWPLLSFAHILTLGEASPVLRGMLVGLSLALAYVTVHFVENPIRFGVARKIRPGRVVGAGLAAGVCVALLAGGIYVGARHGLFGVDPRIAKSFGDRSPNQAKCLLADDPHAVVALPADCLADSNQPRIVLWGDSHADEWIPAVDAWVQSRPGWRVEQLTLGACPPLLGVVPTNPKGTRGLPYQQCNRFNTLVSGRLGNPGGGPVIAILGANWLPRAGIPSPDGADDAGVTQYFDSAVLTEPASLRALENGLERSLMVLDSARTPSIVVLQSPSIGRLPAACIVRLGADRCTIQRRAFSDRAAIVNDVIRRVVRRHPLSGVVDPVEILCSGPTCSAELDGSVAYYDEEHVSASTASSARSERLWGPALDLASQMAIGLAGARGMTNP